MPKSGTTVTAEAGAETGGAERLILQQILFSVHPCQCLLKPSTKDHNFLYAAELDHLEGK